MNDKKEEQKNDSKQEIKNLRQRKLKNWSNIKRLFEQLAKGCNRISNQDLSTQKERKRLLKLTINVTSDSP